METNIAKIPVNKDDIFEKWLMITKIGHHLVDSEIKVAAKFLQYNYELMDKITDFKIRMKYLRSTDIRKEIRESLDLETRNYQNFLSSLRRKRFFLEDDIINPRFIPKMSKTEVPIVVTFQLVNKPINSDG